jgi:hypothetical protein
MSFSVSLKSFFSSFIPPIGAADLDIFSIYSSMAEVDESLIEVFTKGGPGG